MNISSKELDFDEAVCVAVICYSWPICTTYSEIKAMTWTKIHAKFRGDIPSNKVFDDLIFMASTNERLLGEKKMCAKVHIGTT